MTPKPDRAQLQEAMKWLLRFNEADTEALRARHGRWLSQDPVHEIAWRQVNQAWSLVGESKTAAETVCPSRLQEARRDWERRHEGHSWRDRLQWGALAAAVCLGLFSATVMLVGDAPDYATTTAESRSVTLTDGSLVHLDAETALQVEMNESARSIRLRQGRAFFTVTRDETRPFTVRAGETTVTVLGTAFDVNLTEQRLTVAVQHGSVAVRRDAHGLPPVEARLRPGDQVRMDRETGTLVAGRLAPEDVAGWTSGQLFVADTPIAEVVAELARYHRGWILVADDGVGRQKVTGLYNLRSPETALRAAVQPVGGKVFEITPFLTIVSGASD